MNSLKRLLTIFILFAAAMQGACSKEADPSPTPLPDSEGAFSVQDCVGMNGVSEACYWRYMYDSNVCDPTSPCDKLVVIFAGGEENCDESMGDSSAAYSQAMARYVDDGYVAICAGTFLSSGQNGQPYFEESDRLNAVTASIRGSSIINSIWSGKYLLWAGVSHGATVPPIAMMRKRDTQPTWQGSTKTGACFHDGTYNVLQTDAFLKLSQNLTSCIGVRKSAICDRYSTAGPILCTSPPSSDPDVITDTITNGNVSNLAIKNWKLVECGSGLPAPACGTTSNLNGDWLPASTIQSLCNRIDQDSTHTCEFGSLPSDGHLTCVGTEAGVDECSTWFDNLL